MMRCISLSGKANAGFTAETQRTQRGHTEDMDYSSEKTVESAVAPGVRFTISRMSFGRRVELTREIWGLAGRVEYLAAGDDAREKLQAALLASEIERTYLRWGLCRIEGLTIDGQPATPESAIASGPEELCREMAAAIKAECGLTDEERKN
jgi:hypothetical protein